MSNTGITEIFSEMGNSIGESMRQEWKRRLLDDKIDYKRSILLSLKRQYPNIQDAVLVIQKALFVENSAFPIYIILSL